MKLLLPLGLITLLFTSTSYAAGFDCTKAKTDSQKTICNTTSLSSLDELLALSFNKALSSSADSKALKTAQQSWLKSRDACVSDLSCLTKSYTSRLSELISLIAQARNQAAIKPAPATPKPTQPVTQAPTNTQKAPPTSTGKTLTGKITSYECGDNCYLTVQDEQGKKHVALCTAPLCESWNEVAEMPASYLKKKVTVTLGRAKQYDGAGNEMGEMDAFESITLLE